MLSWEFNSGKKKETAKFSKLNGSEPKLDKEKWNGDPNIMKTHNCYAYVLDIINPKFQSKPQPGYSSGYSYLSDKDIRSCDKMFERIKADNPTTTLTTFEEACPSGHRKGFIAVDPSEDADYHFYRQDSKKYWSHKPGSTEVRTVNSDGKKIIAPHKSKRQSSSHNYTKSCGYFCFDPSKSKLSNRPIKK